MVIDKVEAASVLRQEAANAKAVPPLALWVKKLDELDRLCGNIARTHIAAIGTALLAKSVDVMVDVFALKVERNGPRAYSARSLAKDVLAALAPELEMDIGVYGREPLNNQPYFRESRISREMPVRPNARPALLYVVELLLLIDKIETVEKARELLRTYITVRQAQFRRPGLIGAVGQLPPSVLLERIAAFTATTSEGGKRAQAAVAGLLDAAFGADLVEVGRINDPDRGLPGDVAVLRRDGAAGWSRVFEVRDKPVSEPDLHHLLHKAAHGGVDRVSMLALALAQKPLDGSAAVAKAKDGGIELAVRFGWSDFLAEVIFWGETPRADFAGNAAQMIDARLVELDATPQAIAEWRGLNES